MALENNLMNAARSITDKLISQNDTGMQNMLSSASAGAANLNQQVNGSEEISKQDFSRFYGGPGQIVCAEA